MIFTIFVAFASFMTNVVHSQEFSSNFTLKTCEKDKIFPDLCTIGNRYMQPKNMTIETFFSIKSIYEISEDTGTYKIDFNFQMTWKDDQISVFNLPLDKYV